MGISKVEIMVLVIQLMQYLLDDDAGPKIKAEIKASCQCSGRHVSYSAKIRLRSRLDHSCY